MSMAAFIPLRGNSKSIPNKNIKLFCGKPLAYWVIKAASDCPSIDQVYVATESKKIKQVVESFHFANVQVIDRSEYTTTDEAATELAMLEFANHYEYDHIILIQATSPLLETIDLQKAIYQYDSAQADSLVAVVRQKRFLWKQGKSSAISLNYNPLKRPRRQDWEGYFVENGSFYITSRSMLLQSGCRISGRTHLYEMDDATYFEIDEYSDWFIAEQLKKNRSRNSEIFERAEKDESV